MQGKYGKLIEDSAKAQVDWWLAQLYDNTEWMLDGEGISDTDYNAVHSAVMQRTVELLTD